MKIIFTSILLLNTFLNVAYCQCTDFYIKTPKGTNVKACTDGNHDPAIVAMTDQQTRAYAIQVIEGGNDSYNCHAYAWHVSEGGNNVWLNNMYTETKNVDNYWNDGSYIQVASQPASMAHVKVFYGSTTSENDHTAVTTTDPNVFISKMGCGVLCSHLKTNSPYDDLGPKKYFVRYVEVSGEMQLCNSNTVTYSTLSFINCTYNWTFDESKLNYISGQGSNNFKIAPKNPLVPGLAWVKLSLTVNSPINKTWEVTTNVWVGAPPVITSISGPSSVSVNQPASFTAQLLSFDSSPDSYFWTTSPSSGVTIYPDGRYASISFTNSNTYQVVAKAHNSCGWSDYALTYVTVSGGYYLAISPNPATTEATVELISTSTEKNMEETEWDLEVYDAIQSMKTKTQKIKGNKQTISTSGWKYGVYIVRAIVGKDIISEKLVVKQ